ncbi:MAG: HNH endonuclease [Gaiellaceae bacterium]
MRARDGNRCRNCGATEKLSVHHVVRGGPDLPENLITLCSRCHYYAERASQWARGVRRRIVIGSPCQPTNGGA